MRRFAKIAVLLLALFAVVADAIAQNRAPKGGTYVNGRFYNGGQFLPGGSSVSSGFSGGFSGSGGTEFDPSGIMELNAAAASAKRAARAKRTQKIQERSERLAQPLTSSPTDSISSPNPAKTKETTQRLFGKIVGVIDGDTVDLLTEDQETIRIRLEGIDAPEKNQPFGTAAKSALSNAAFGKNVMVNVTGKDSYKRTLGTIFASGSDINRSMVTSGMAWHFVKYNSDPALAAAEKAARVQRRGLWADGSPVPPWDWRNRRPLPSASQ